MSCTPLCSVAKHLLCGAALRGGRLALAGPTWLLALDVLTLHLSALHHWGDLAAISRLYGPPGQSWRLQLVAHGVDQSGEVDEVGNRLRSGASTGAHRLRDKLGGSVVEHGGAADCIEGDSEDGIVKCEGTVAGCQVTYSDRLQAGELGRGMAGDGGDGDVGQTH